ncbi:MULTISPECIES: hypothetical protein [unclassified Thermoactinomyces]|uniref:hypothetical protein n=1 Tax=unclassified Thermoactinomyces TaxID=2634588 RepID=UPI0018DE2DAA|nr:MULTISPECIES: hypothetical protein [unclassified Thermoactinomyces]MBH8599461.1 hypothetical protein [Thermoactinomyces sp. CICC 10523]MBH8605249.1 hypothetical protein [Thermoactinomyces sp. CICC 10522]MBH8608168.1 hypothetical protein [Thermoactinomyces sp. CICC 10521]
MDSNNTERNFNGTGKILSLLTAVTDQGKKISATEKMIKKMPFSDGILLGGVTGLGYFAAYLSDVSYKEYYGLPSLYADVSLNTVILAVASIVFVILVLAMFLQRPYAMRYGKFVLPVILPFSIGLLLGLKLDYQFKQSLWEIFFFFLVYVLLTALLLFFAMRQNWLLTGLALVMIVISVSRASGYIIASNQTEYLVTQGSSPYVVVDTYKDGFVMMPVDLKRHVILPEVLFVDQAEQIKDSLRLREIKTGPLTVEGKRD